MAGERHTLVGTPVVIAPGKIFLVGEYAVLEDGPAVLAAVSRHAIAQYIPGMDPMSAVVAEAVKRARAEIGEAAAALPLGSVLVNTDDFQQGQQKLGLGSSAATAVATVGALFESAGISVAKNRPQILAIAHAAHQAAQGGVGSGADVAAAVEGFSNRQVALLRMCQKREQARDLLQQNPALGFSVSHHTHFRPSWSERFELAARVSKMKQREIAKCRGICPECPVARTSVGVKVNEIEPGCKDASQNDVRRAGVYRDVQGRARVRRPNPDVTVGPNRIRAAPLAPHGARRCRRPDHRQADNQRSGVAREP